MAEALSVIPKHCFEKDTVKSLGYAALSTAMTVGLGVLAYLYIPLQARSRMPKSHSHCASSLSPASQAGRPRCRGSSSDKPVPVTEASLPSSVSRRAQL